jgi:hypothetical protein
MARRRHQLLPLGLTTWAVIALVAAAAVCAVAGLFPIL